MRSLLPGLLMLTESVVFLLLEWRLRRASRWRQGALDHVSVGVVAGPLIIFLVAALVFSTGGWDLLRLPGILTVLALPVALGAALRAAPGERGRTEDGEAATAAGALRRWRPTALAVSLSLTGLVALSVGEGSA